MVSGIFLEKISIGNKEAFLVSLGHGKYKNLDRGDVGVQTT